MTKNIYTIRITSKFKPDSRGQNLLAEIKKTLKIKSIKDIKTAKIYRLEGLKEKEAITFAQKVLYEPIDQLFSFQKPIFKNATKVIEVAYKPGVMNPEVASLIKSASDLGMSLKAADSSWEYAFFGKISPKELNLIIKKLLINETVEHIVKSSPKTLLITGSVGKVNKIPIRNLNDKQLLDLSKDRLFLNLEEMKILQNYFRKIRRDPTDCEVETIAQTWSEHCVHKTFKAKLTIDGKIKEPLFTRIKKTAKNNSKIIVSAFVDNSGVIDFYDGFAISGKVETHNSPSAIEPYGGAMTGSGGVFRDVLGTGQGAKVVAASDIFCLAPPGMPAKLIPPKCLAPEYILRKVIAGVRDYGNRVGIPTNNGSLHFHEDFRAKPTVAVGAFGLIPKKMAKKATPQKGDLILSVGGATGRDGIHGATFSSAEMSAKTSETSGSAVQIGNAIEEKRVIDFILAARDKGLIRTLTDCGAGGYSSAVGEMGEEIGARVNLEKVPLKYPGLAPWEIFLSESQERMVLAVAPKNLKEIMKLSKIYNVASDVIGQFDGSGQLNVTYRNQKVCTLEMKFLHHGLPQRHMIGKSLVKSQVNDSPKLPKNLSGTWFSVMAHGNVASKEPIVRLYDHNVQGTSALHPFGGVDFDAPNDGAIVTPLIQKKYGLVITHGLNPVLNTIDPYWGSIWAFTEALSNYVSIGGDLKEAALIDNFVWPFPDEESLADLDKAVDALCFVARKLRMPFVSGKDSLSSTYRFPNGKLLKVPPVTLISVFGKIPDVTKTVSADFKKAGSTIVLVGKPDIESMAGSVYFQLSQVGNTNMPKPDINSLNSIFQKITKGIRSGNILACHDISEGGLATSLAEMSFGGGVGAKISLSKIASARPDFILFNETPGTFLVEVESENLAKKLFANVPYFIIGKTVKDREIVVNDLKKTIAKVDTDKLKTAWQKPMKEIFN